MTESRLLASSEEYVLVASDIVSHIECSSQPSRVRVRSPRELTESWSQLLLRAAASGGVPLDSPLPGPGTHRSIVAGARLVADAGRLPTVQARWWYKGGKRETRKMVRIGLVA